MEASKEYPGFVHVDAKYKVGDIVDWEFIGYKEDEIITCVIDDVETLADHEDNYEASYTITELIRGRITESSRSSTAYESELKLNKKYVRDRELDKILGPEPRKKRITE
jgi:hypothetical protein